MKASDFNIASTSLLLFVLFAASHLMAGEDWKIVESKSGINIYERWVKVNSNLTVKERKGEMIIEGTMNSVINILCDPTKTKLWMENVSDSYLIDKRSDKEWSSYTYFSLPWPLENRDMVSVSSLKYNTPGTAIIEIESKESTLPLNKNVTRLMNYKASWEIADIGNGHIFISLSAISSTAPEYPRFILDPIVRGAFMRNLYKLKLIISI
jgi:hypothetical protein